MIKCANSSNLIRCNKCQAVYDKTLKWIRGYYEGTSDHFNKTSDVQDNCCPVCGKEKEE